MLLYVLIAGALLGFAVLALRCAIKLFVPRRHHAAIDLFLMKACAGLDELRCCYFLR